MKRSFQTKEAEIVERAGEGNTAAGAGLNITIVYQDAGTRRWARQLCTRLEQLVGLGGIRPTWWKMGDLDQPGVLAGAVSKALRADVLVVAFHAADPLPLQFYVWAEAWTPLRNGMPGSLLALIDLPSSPGMRCDEGREYLRAAARQARLDFLTEERKLKGDVAFEASDSASSGATDSVAAEEVPQI